MASTRWAEGGRKLRCYRPRRLRRRTHQMQAPERLQRKRAIYHVQTPVVRTERGALTWSCSNPDHGDLGASRALNCSIASTALAWSSRNSQIHRPQERRQVSREELVWRTPSASRLDTRQVVASSVPASRVFNLSAPLELLFAKLATVIRRWSKQAIALIDLSMSATRRSH